MDSRRFIGSSAKNTPVHQLRLVRDQRAEIHLGQNVPFKINAGRNLDQFEPLLGQPEHAALRDIEHRFAAAARDLTREGDVLDRVHELAHLAVAHDLQRAVAAFDVERAGNKHSGEHDLLGVLADIDEAARARELADRTWRR